MKPLHLLVLCLGTLASYCQKTDTLLLFYKSDQFTITKQDKLRLDSFLRQNWDRVLINGYTDETDSEGYNLELSKKRSGTVYDYFVSKNFNGQYMYAQFFGESMPQADNASDDGRAMNRRTEIIGYQFPRIAAKPREDPMKPVTKTLDNGFIITYRPGAIPLSWLENFEAGTGMGFQMLTNTVEMRQNNLYNNTTRGEILSSVLIVCGERLKPCKLDSPIMIKIPIPFKTKCPIEKVKFFNAVAEKGKRIWQEQTKQLYPETINGVQYIRIWMDNFCQCINFDFKIDPECFDTDSTRLLFVNANVRNLTAEIRGLNSLYMPRKVNDSTHSILFLKDKMEDAAISFAVYKGKKRIRSFVDQQLTALPYDETSKQYVISTRDIKFHFPRSRMYDVILKVNKDRYKTAPLKNKYDFVYLNRQTEKILVDFSVMDAKGRVTQFKDQPIERLPYDANSGYHVIDKKFIKALKQNLTLAKL
jgi:hypothetical protein